jgi:hypothetical protein
MKIAALILAHKRPDLLSALVMRLSSPLWSVYIHIDKKSSIEEFTAAIQGVAFISERKSVYWGGFSQIEATISLLTRALEDPENTHFYLMSGQCFPIKTDEQIADALSRGGANSGNFMSLAKMPEIHKPLSRLTGWYYYDSGNPVIFRVVNRLLSLLPKKNLTRLLRGMEPWAGPQWWMLSRASAEGVIKFIDENPWFLQAFRYTLCSDECFFQTIIHNLGIEIDSESPTKTYWGGEGRGVDILTPDKILEATNGWHLFLRKFE